MESEMGWEVSSNHVGGECQSVSMNRHKSAWLFHILFGSAFTQAALVCKSFLSIDCTGF